MFQNVQSNTAGGGDEEAGTPNGAEMAAIKEWPELIEHRSSGLAFQLSDCLGQVNRGRRIQNKMDVVLLSVDLVAVYLMARVLGRRSQ